MPKEPIPEAELNSAKEYIKGNMYINAESNDSRMNRLAKNEFLFGRYVPFEEIEKKINRVTSEDIQTWFRGIYSPDKMAAMLYGPVEMESERLENSLSARIEPDVSVFPGARKRLPGERDPGVQRQDTGSCRCGNHLQRADAPSRKDTGCRQRASTRSL